MVRADQTHLMRTNVKTLGLVAWIIWGHTIEPSGNERWEPSPARMTFATREACLAEVRATLEGFYQMLDGIEARYTRTPGGAIREGVGGEKTTFRYVCTREGDDPRKK